jgi:electron transport complex protein RnfG
MREIIKMLLVLTVLSLMSGGLLAAIHNETKEKAALQVIKYVKGPALRKILAEATNDPTTDRFDIQDGEVLRSFFVGVLDGEPRAVAFETFGKGGYGGYVGLMVAVDVKEEKLISVSVTTHSETPGMGARVETDQGFIGQFQELAAKGPFKIRQDGGSINTLSGATLTSRAFTLAATEAGTIYKRLQPQIVEKMKEFQK